jgi:hypothetical protein
MEGTPVRTLLLASLILFGAVAMAEDELTPLPLELPRKVFTGTPKQPPQGVKLEPGAKEERAPFMVARGLVNLARDKSVIASEKEPIIGEIKQATDGDKDGVSGSYVELGSGLQWLQVDLGALCQVHAIVFWFYHGAPLVYHDVVVQVSDDADFITNVKTLFNNDFDNSSGLGVGNDFEFYETYQGKLVDARSDRKPTVARYVRVYSKGNTEDDTNRFTELEVWGRPVKNEK